MTTPPEELSKILRTHLDKIRPTIFRTTDRLAGIAIFTLLVQGAKLSPSGEVISAGDGVLMGPLDMSRREIIYTLYPLHMPALKDRVDTEAPGRLLIVTCQAALDGEERSYTALLEVPGE